MLFKHISNIMMSLKTPTNIITSIGDIIITQVYLTDLELNCFYYWKQ